MATTGELIYRLAAYLVPYGKRAEIREIAEDYEEYLTNYDGPGEPDAPRVFATASLEDMGRRKRMRLTWKMSAGFTIFLMIWWVIRNVLMHSGIRNAHFVVAGLMAVVLPAALWLLLGCGTLLSYARQCPHTARDRKIALIGVALMALLSTALWFGINGWILWWVEQPEQVTNRMSSLTVGTVCQIILKTMILLGMLVLFVSLCGVRRRSPWYFCTGLSGMALSLLSYFMLRYLTCMDTSIPQMGNYLLPAWFCVPPWLMAMAWAVASAIRIAVGLRKGAS